MTDNKKAAIDWDSIHRYMAEIADSLAQGTAPGMEKTREILRARAEALAREPETRGLAGETFDIVEFILAGEHYGIETAYVREVYSLRDLVKLPGMPAFILGITNVRGQIISVIDLKKLFDLPEKGLAELDKIIIVNNGEIETSIRADSVLGSHVILSNTLQPSLPTIVGIREKYLKGISINQVAVLDMKKLLSDKTMVINETVK